MDVSFVIPVLNGENFIRQCLESIFSEKNAEDEVIVIDNGSTDSTVSIVKSFDGVKVLVQPDLTVSALRNFGAHHVSKQLLAFIDADVVLCKGWRKKAVETFQDERIDAAGSRYGLPENALWIEKAWYSQKNIEKRTVEYINAGNFLIKPDVFENLGGFDATLSSDEDCEFGERLNKAGYLMLEDPEIRSVHLGNPKSLKGFYRKELWHATSVLATKSSKMFNRPTVMSIIFGMTIMLSIMAIVASIWFEVNYFWVSISVVITPFVTALFRAFQYNIYKHIPALTLLWGIFYMARVRNMVSHIF